MGCTWGEELSHADVHPVGTVQQGTDDENQEAEQFPGVHGGVYKGLQLINISPRHVSSVVVSQLMNPLKQNKTRTYTQ